MIPKPTTGQRLTRAAILLLLLGAALGLGYWFYKLVSDPVEKPRKRAVQEISLLRPPPPPKTQPPPPPPKMEQERIDVPRPDAPADKPAEAPPPGPDLAVDAAGSGSGDSFGLVGKPGGTDLLAIGGGGGGGVAGDKFAWFSALVKERIQDAVEEAARRDKNIRAAGNTQRTVHVWVGPGGKVSRVELIGAGASPGLDEALRKALRNVAAVREAAPSDMPQPIRLRITTRS